MINVNQCAYDPKIYSFFKKGIHVKDYFITVKKSMNNAQQTKSDVTYESVISALLMSTDVILDNQIHQISPISKDFMIC